MVYYIMVMSEKGLLPSQKTYEIKKKIMEEIRPVDSKQLSLSLYLTEGFDETITLLSVPEGHEITIIDVKDFKDKFGGDVYLEFYKFEKVGNGEKS